MKPSLIAAAITAAALPVLAQTSTAPVEPRQARVEVADPAGGTAAAPKKASKAKSSKPVKTAKKTSKKKAAKKKPQAVG
jgi:hypothetical protein